MEEITEGSVLCGRYRLVRHLGGGSFGEVWLCVDQSTNSEIALKICSKLNKDSERDGFGGHFFKKKIM